MVLWWVFGGAVFHINPLKYKRFDSSPNMEQTPISRITKGERTSRWSKYPILRKTKKNKNKPTKVAQTQRKYRKKESAGDLKV